MATAPFRWFLSAPLTLGRKEVNLGADTIRLTLHTTAPDRVNATYYSDVQASELGTGGGYTVGGFAVGGVSWTKLAADSWPVQRTATTAYALNATVRPAAANGYIYRAVQAGTTGTTTPTWPTTAGQTVTDGTVIWACIGIGAPVLAANPVSVPSGFTAGPFRYLVLRDSTPAAVTAQPLLAAADLGSNETGPGSLTVDWGSPGIVGLPVG